MCFSVNTERFFLGRMSCQTSPAQSQPRRCPPRLQTWRGRTETVRAQRCRLPRGPDLYQWVSSSRNTAGFSSGLHLVENCVDAGVSSIPVLCVLQVCLKMRKTQMCKTSLSPPLSWIWTSLDTNPAGNPRIVKPRPL